MSRVRVAVFAACAALSLVTVPARAADNAPPARETLALVGFTILPMTDDGEPLREHVLLVSDGRIARLAPANEVEIPSTARVIDGAGQWLMPGLVEMHGHLPGNSGGGSSFADDVLFLYLANGVTSVRGMLGDPAQLLLRDAIAAGERAGPRLFVGSPPLHGGLGLSVERAAALVADYAAAGYDHLKVHEGLSPDVFAAIASAAEQHDLAFGGHVADAVGLWTAVDAGQSTVDHMDNVLLELLPPEHAGGVATPHQLVEHVDLERLPELAQRLAESGAAVVPTQALWVTLNGGASGTSLRARLSEVRFMPTAMVDQWEAQVNAQAAAVGAEVGAAYSVLRDVALAGLAEADVPVLLGTDSPQLFSVPGFSMHREIQVLRAAGLSAEAILDAGTSAVSRFYGESYAAGQLLPGLRADLLLLDGDPRADLAVLERPLAVIADGRVWSRERLDVGLQEIERRHAG
ncbi:MAG: amidohydrolase [Planctomycetota bacterium]|nr:MAG: amidohydrolase [Planctomycetota bacterium]